jgi:sigma-B regulation protein RsbU (phosphoserine phosphatase)
MENSKKVLIIDDEAINNKLIKKLLTSFGMDAVMLTDPTKTFDVLTAEGPDLILLDLMMPVQDGFTTLSLIKSHDIYRELPVIILSGEASEDILARCLKIGAVDYLTKPVRKMELEARVTSAIKIAELNRSLNSKLEELQSVYEGIASELEIARKIQMSIIGPKIVNTPTLKIFSHLEIANRLGGDFFDIKQFDGKIVGTIADVSGHGVSSSLIVMMLKTLLNSYANAENSPSTLLKILHNQLYNTIPKGYYIALSHFVYQGETGVLTFSNAGLYDAIVIRRDGSVEQFGSKSFAVAFVGRADFKETEILLEKGDKVVFHTDGINEAVNEFGEMYSRDRLLQVLARNAQADAENLFEAMMMDRKLFIGEILPEDDSTIMILQVI